MTKSILYLCAAGLLAGCGDSPSAPRFTVGGTVAGLAGAGLVLENNGTDALTISGSGPFTFPATIARGAGYSVTVRTHPANQQCVVANGSGTMGGANVTNITVTCVTPSFTIGGTVTGLSGTLVLLNNGTNNLTIVANGEFTFSTPLASGALYAVSVLTQPTGQTCDIVNATGTTTARVVNVIVTCTSFLGSYEVVTATTTTGAAGSVGTASALCPATKRVLGGGYRAASGNEVWRVWRSKPVDAGGSTTGDRGWAISFTSVVAGQSVTVYAVCAIPLTGLGYEVVSSATTTPAIGSAGTLSFLCPGVRRVMGGGFSSSSTEEVWRLSSSRPIGDGGAQPNRGWSLDFTSVQGGQAVSSHLICAQAPLGMGYDIVTAVATTGTEGNNGTVSVTCQPAARALSGGFLSSSGAEVWRVWRSYPSDASGTAGGDRGWSVDFTSIVAGQSVSAFVVCASATMGP